MDPAHPAPDTGCCAAHPPRPSSSDGRAMAENLTSTDRQNLNDVRRAVWVGGARGAAYGLGTLTAAVVLARVGVRIGVRLPVMEQLEPRHWTAGFLCTGALGAAVGAVAAGKNNAWRLSDVYMRGAKPILTPYQKVQRGDAAGDVADADLGYDGRAATLRDYGYDPAENRRRLAERKTRQSRWSDKAM